mmetsp:Transcript_4641/g.4825  ORF Transcript_4641/g.4825 Transcript_4641/m.4825 type:complete len:296 (+) Transcript_4641:16-903(+)
MSSDLEKKPDYTQIKENENNETKKNNSFTKSLVTSNKEETVDTKYSNVSVTPIESVNNNIEKEVREVKNTNNIKDNVSENSADSRNYQILFKVILIGDSGIGKTSMINRYINNLFTEKYLCTIGVDFMMKTIMFEDTTVKLQVWDTAGMERYRQITTSYYRGANAAIIAFDLTNRKTFESLKHWINLYYEYSNQLISKCIVLVGNKSDLESQRQVLKEDVEDLLKINPNFIYFEVSALSGENVEKVFLSITEKLYYEVKNNGFTDIKDKRNTGSFKSISSGDFKNIIKKNKKCTC